MHVQRLVPLGGDVQARALAIRHREVEASKGIHLGAAEQLRSANEAHAGSQDRLARGPVLDDAMQAGVDERGDRVAEECALRFVP